MADITQNNWSETDASNNQAAPDGAPEGMPPSGVNDTLRAIMGAVKRWFGWSNVKTTGGTGTAYTLSYSVAPTALSDGMTHLVQFHATNGAPATLNVNSLGAKPIHYYTGGAWAAIPAGTITANMVGRVAYNLADGTYRLTSIPVAITATTKSVGDNTTAVATTAFVQAAVSASAGTKVSKVYVQTFTGNGTYTPHVGLINCIIECVGGAGGGGGAGGSSAPGGNPGHGGGGGGYSRKMCTAADIGASKPVTVGAGGAGGSTGANAGSAGGDTSVGSLCVARGGAGGGTGAGGVGGAGGIAGTGDISLPGERGKYGMFSVNLSSVSGYGGPGGSAGAGFGAGAGNSVTLNVQTDGAAGSNYGGGGAGGLSANGGGTAAGGSGAPGVVIITEFCNE